MNNKRRIAFIRWGSFSHINDCVLQILERYFEDARIDVIDINDLIPRRNPLAYLSLLRDYGQDVMLRRRAIHEARERTTFVFQKVRERTLELLRRHDYAFTFQTQSMFDASKPGIPHFVYTDCTYLTHLKFPNFTRRDLPSDAWMECEKTIYRNATKVFAMSTNVCDTLIEDYGCPPEKVGLVYCGANVKVEPDEQFDASRYAKKRILFVGIDWPRKGGPVLVEAFKKVLDRHPDASLTVVGCSPKLNLPNCNVVGRIPLADVKKHFEQATVFCLPTLLEPFGIVFLEAMAHGVPIVATRLGAIPDFVSNDRNGYLVEPNDPQELADRLSSLLSQPDKIRQFGESARQLFWQRYTWEATGIRIHQQIEDSLKTSQSFAASNRRPSPQPVPEYGV